MPQCKTPLPHHTNPRWQEQAAAETSLNFISWSIKCGGIIIITNSCNSDSPLLSQWTSTGPPPRTHPVSQTLILVFPAHLIVQHRHNLARSVFHFFSCWALTLWLVKMQLGWFLCPYDVTKGRIKVIFKYPQSFSKPFQYTLLPLFKEYAHIKNI